MKSKKKLGLALALAGLMSFHSIAAAANVSLTIDNGDVKDVLAALSSISGQSIVTDDNVKGTISIDLADVPFETALDIITRSKGLSYKTISNVIIVSTTENMDKNFGNVSAYKIQYANAKDVVEAVKGVVKSGLSFDPITNTVLFSGTTGDETKLKEALKVLDVATKQITLEAKIVAVNADSARDLGIAWQWSELPEKETTSSDSDDKMGGIIRWGVGGYTTRFQGILSALESKGKANILATPRLITLPGKQASIFIGDHIPVVTEKTSSSGSTSATTEYVDAGIKLEYTPIVSNDDYVTSAVHTEVSSATKDAQTQKYVITSRTADTNIRMRNGETLVIGGLINEEEMKTYQAIPLLSKIPVLGELFKYRNKTKKKTEVMMILTPYITNSGESPAIYDNRIKNYTLTPVPGTADADDAETIQRELAATKRAKKEAAKAAAEIKPVRETRTVRTIDPSVIEEPETTRRSAPKKVATIEEQKKQKPLTMRERADRILAQQIAESKAEY